LVLKFSLTVFICVNQLLFGMTSFDMTEN